WGGIAHYTWNLCAALAGGGVEVSLLTNREWELAHLSSAFQVDRCFSAGAGYLGNVKALRERVARVRPGVVHVQSVISTRLAALLRPLIRPRARRSACRATGSSCSPSARSARIRASTV